MKRVSINAVILRNEAIKVSKALLHVIILFILRILRILTGKDIDYCKSESDSKHIIRMNWS